MSKSVIVAVVTIVHILQLQYILKTDLLVLGASQTYFEYVQVCLQFVALFFRLSNLLSAELYTRRLYHLLRSYI